MRRTARERSMEHCFLHWQPLRNAEKDEGDERLPRSIEESRRRLVDAKRGRNERPFKRNERSLCLPLRTAQQAFRAVE